MKLNNDVRGELGQQLSALQRDIAIAYVAYYDQDHLKLRDALERMNSILLTAYARANDLTLKPLPLNIPLPTESGPNVQSNRNTFANGNTSA